MRYIGSKERLLDFIDEVLIENNLKEGRILDVFGGTGSVGKHLKRKGFEVYGNDIMFFSYIIQYVAIQLNHYPLFENVVSEKDGYEAAKQVIQKLNSLEGVEGFTTLHYSPKGQEQRMYFTEENAKKIDAIRNQIEKWFHDKKISKDEYYILIAALIQAVPFVSNISGVYGAYLKKWDKRALKEIKLEVPEIIPSNHKNLVFNRDANKLALETDVDILYLDPPYNARQYAPNYHVLETIAKWDNPQVKGKTGLRPYDEQKSDYCYKNKVISTFEEMIRDCKSEHILLSYNSEGLMKKEDIEKTASKYGEVKFYSLNYRRYKSDNENVRNIKNNSVDEYIFYVKKSRVQ